MKSKSAEATASALRNYISFMGVPKVLLTDNDPTFRSEVFFNCFIEVKQDNGIFTITR